MQVVIPPVDRALLKSELTAEKFLRYTNNGNNHIYLVDYHDSPNTVREIGRLRELT
ncbi:MAG: hemolysin, partial [Cyclobacteriaceae bacterium]|nr:hemolysin [Cyclobacteriaceae bacterium]